MKIRNFLATIGTALGLLAATMASAHHSGVMYEEKKEVVLEGVVKKFQFANPHCWLIVTVTNKDGTTTTWGFEAESGGPPAMKAAGIRIGDFPAGTKVRMRGRPMKDGRPAAAWIEAVRLSDNKSFHPGGRSEPKPKPAE